jgi:1,4-dihydroxy-2-naphthoyl-CoA hydrolase
MNEAETRERWYGFEPAVSFADSFDGLYGLEFGEGSEAPDVVGGRVSVHPELLDRRGALAGGVFAALAESLASRGTALAVVPDGQMAMGQSNDTTVTGTVRAGVLHGEARVVARGAQNWVWTVEARDDAQRLVAFSRVTIAVRPMRR